MRLRGLRLALLCRLVHGIEDAEVVLRMLEVAFRLHAVTAAGRIAPKLEVLLEQLLGRAAQTDVRAVAVENVIAVQRDAAASVMPDVRAAAAAAAAASTAASTARAMIAATHAFHVHGSAVVLSRCGQAWDMLGRNREVAPGAFSQASQDIHRRWCWLVPGPSKKATHRDSATSRRVEPSRSP